MFDQPVEADDRVRVYLSSSMATPEHCALRQELKSYLLDEDKLLDVYAIETLASGYGPDELMPHKVLWADVVLMLLQDDLRQGVEYEYDLARRNGKRLIVLVHSGTKSNELQDFIASVKKEGHVYLGNYSGLDDLRPLARRSLRADVVDVYREVQRQLFVLRSQVRYLIPSQAKRAHAFLREELGPGSNSAAGDRAPEEAATRALMRAFLDGAGSMPGEPLRVVFDGVPQEYKRTVQLRWDGISAALVGDYSLAIQMFRAAKAEAATGCLPKWVERDIVLDLQYMEVCRANRGEAGAIERLGSFKQALQSLAGWDARSPVYYDLYAMAHGVLEEAVDAELLGERTIVLGTNVLDHLDRLSEALVAATWLGSYGLMRTVRSLLGQLCLHYGFIQNSQQLLIEGVRQLALAADLSRLEKFLKTSSAIVAERANESLLAPGAFPGLDVAMPERWRARCLLLEHLGDYVADENLDSAREFLENCYEYGLKKGDKGSVMRQALGALSGLASRLDPQWVIERTLPLLSAHPVLAHEAERALSQIALQRLSEEDLLSISRALLSRRSRPQLPSLLSLLVMISDISESAGPSIAEAFLEDWRTSASWLSIEYFARSNAHLEAHTSAEMASAVCKAIDASDRAVVASSPLGFGGISPWGLLSALLEKGAEVDDQELGTLAARVLCNTSQSSNGKRDCMKALLWQARIGRTRIVELVSNHLIAREQEVLSVRMGELPFFQASRHELELLLAGVQAAAHPEAWPSLVRALLRGSASTNEDARQATVELLRLVERPESSEYGDTVIGLLSALTRDSARAVRIAALHGLSEQVRRETQLRDLVADRVIALSEDRDPAVREAVAYAAGAWREDDWALSVLLTLSRDRNYRVRRTAMAVAASES